jgi:hypothetical protein
VPGEGGEVSTPVFRVVNGKRYPPALTSAELQLLEDVARVILENQDSLGGADAPEVKHAFVHLRLIGMLRESES